MMDCLLRIELLQTYFMFSNLIFRGELIRVIFN